MPERIQLSRKKGWRKPENTVVVARPTKWGNPYTLAWARRYWDGYDIDLRGAVVAEFRTNVLFTGENDYPTREQVRAELAGKNLACWCPLDQPCHADVLLEIANQDLGGSDNG